MSANNARRRRSGEADVGQRLRKPAKRVRALVQLRDELALCAAECDAHGVPCAADLRRAATTLELLIKADSPVTHIQHRLRWARDDAELTHMSADGHPRCRICGELASPPRSRAITAA